MTDMTLDVRGRPCPEPVVETQKALQDPELTSLSVLVDNESSLENVLRMAESMGWAAAPEKREGGFMLVITPKQPHSFQAGPPAARPAQTRNDQPTTSCGGSPSRRVVVLVGTDRFGTGDEDLGRVLMRSFVKTLRQAEQKPRTMLFLHRGVCLTTEGSQLIEDFGLLEKEGVELLSCGTCLDFYHFKEKLKVGRVTNMLEIVTRLLSADQVVRV